MRSPGVTVRPATRADDLDALNAGNPLWMTAARHWALADAAPPGTCSVLYVGELDGEPVGCAVGLAAPKEAYGWGMSRVWVRPDSRRRGVGGALFDATVELIRSYGLPGVMVSVPDSEPDGLAAAAARGLVEHGHHVESVLDLTALDPSVADTAVARVTGAGFVLDELPPAATEDEWHEAHEFCADRASEAPDSREGGGRIPYSIFRTFLKEPWQVVLARRDDELAGITAVVPREDAPARLNTFITGVHPAARGRGLSAALKTEHARRVRAAGWREIVTQNMDQNAPIRAVNERLGFRAIGGTRDLGTAF